MGSKPSLRVRLGFRDDLPTHTFVLVLLACAFLLPILGLIWLNDWIDRKRLSRAR